MNKFVKHSDYVEVIVNSKAHGKKSFMVDYDIFNVIKDYNWSLAPRRIETGTNYYVQNKKLGLLHRFIFDYPDMLCIDHINRNTLDNRKINLRVCNRSVNGHNRAGYGSCKYKYLSRSVRNDRAKPRECWEVKFPKQKHRCFSNKNMAEAYYVECLLNLEGEINGLSILSKQAGSAWC